MKITSELYALLSPTPFIMFGYFKGFWSPTASNSYRDSDSGGQALHGYEYEGGSQDDNEPYSRPDSFVGQQSGRAKGRLGTPPYDVDPPDVRRRSKRKSQSSEHKKTRSLEKENRKMEENVRYLTEELERSERANRDLESKSRTSRATIQKLNSIIDGMKRLAAEHEANLRAVRDETLKLEEYGKRQSEELQRLKNELRQAETHHEQTRCLLEERTKELNGAQKFLTRTDSISGADVISIVESLNAEIFQVAASIAESLDFTYKSSHTEEQKRTASNNTTRMIGTDMMQVFLSRSTQTQTEFDPTPIQIALQICIVRCCVRIAERWVTSNENLDQGLKKIYQRMCEKENPAVSGRWRALTLAQIKSNERHQDVLSYMGRRVTDVLFVAGWSAQEVSDTKPVFSLERLAVVVDLVLRLNTAIGEDITSVEMLPMDIQVGVAFDSSAMDDTYSVDDKGTEHNANVAFTTIDFVAGTTDLGLQMISRDPDVGLRKDILLKPKVILRSAVQEEFLS